MQIDIKVYNFHNFLSHWQDEPCLQHCPACNKPGMFKKHSNYTKYHYSNELRILVVKCLECNTFHAVIPSFSLPGTTLGSKEVEDFLIKRKHKKSRREAGELLINAGVSFRHLKNIEKRFHGSLLNMKSLLPDSTGDYLNGIDYCLHLLKKEQTDNFISRLNQFCLDRNINAVFCNRFNILHFRTIKAGTVDSINMGSTGPPSHMLDSS